MDDRELWDAVDREYRDAFDALFGGGKRLSDDTTVKERLESARTAWEELREQLRSKHGFYRLNFSTEIDTWTVSLVDVLAQVEATPLHAKKSLVHVTPKGKGAEEWTVHYVVDHRVDPPSRATVRPMR